MLERSDSVEARCAWQSLERMLAAVFELKSRAGDEIPDRRGDEHFAGRGQRGDPCAGMDCDSANLVSGEDHLTRDIDALGRPRR